MKNIIGHFKNIFVHKWWVFYYACKLGIPWQGFIHDLSKFSWTELAESIRYYQGNKSPIPVAKNNNGYSEAWQHHKGINKHHYEYWIDNRDETIYLIKIPYKYVLEMLADWLGAFRTYRGYENFEEEKNWWLNSMSHYKLMNGSTKTLIHLLLDKFAEDKSLKGINSQYVKDLKIRYEQSLNKIEKYNG